MTCQADSEWETHVAAIIAVERTVHVFQPATDLFKTSNETSFYLSNRSIGAEQAAAAIRSHWGIENRSHYVRTSHCARSPHVFAKTPRFRQNPQLRSQYPEDKPERLHRPGPLRRRSRRTGLPAIVEVL